MSLYIFNSLSSYKYFPNQHSWTGFGEAPRRRFTNGDQGDEDRHTWGRGQTLGGN